MPKLTGTWSQLCATCLNFKIATDNVEPATIFYLSWLVALSVRLTSALGVAAHLHIGAKQTLEEERKTLSNKAQLSNGVSVT